MTKPKKWRPKFRRRRTPWGRKRKPNLRYMHEWERHVLLRDIRMMVDERDDATDLRFSAHDIVSKYPDAYHSAKRVMEALERMKDSGDVMRDGAKLQARWGHLSIRTQAYQLNGTREEVAGGQRRIA